MPALSPPALGAGVVAVGETETWSEKVRFDLNRKIEFRVVETGLSPPSDP